MLPPEDHDPLTTIDETLHKLRATLCYEVFVPEQKVRAGSVFKIVSLKESLLWRGVELGEGAFQFLKLKQHISAFVLTRASLENTALVYRLLQELRKFKTNSEVPVDFLNREAFGSRMPNREFDSINVLTLIDKLDELVPRFRGMYDTLSEYVHPNFIGVIGTFGRPGDPKHTFRVQPSAAIPEEIGSRLLAVSLDMHFEFDKECRELTDGLS